MLKETLNDIQDHYTTSKDKDARVGHKTRDDHFFGYKSHIAMSPENIITAATVTSGEKGDGHQLPQLIEKTRKNGIEVKTVIGDTAYSGDSNLKQAKEEGFKIVAKVSPSISQGFRSDSEMAAIKGGAKSKSYSITIKSETQTEQMAFQETPEFRELYRTERYKIEAKNAELKNVLGYDRAESYGMDAMQMQGAITMFAANVKRIIKLIGETK